ncbi:MAG: hypothetical protein AAF627_20905, partial [Myxococcota bacterium]
MPTPLRSLRSLRLRFGLYGASTSLRFWGPGPGEAGPTPLRSLRSLRLRFGLYAASTPLRFWGPGPG